MAFIGEAAISAFFEALFRKLNSSEFKLVTEDPVRKEVVKWETILKDIHAVLADAEGKQLQSQAVKIWLGDLQDLAYDVDDILDEFATEALGRKLMKERQASSLTCCTGLHPSSIKSNHKMMSKFEDITRRLEGLATRKNNLHLREIAYDVGMAMTIPTRRQSTSVVNEATVRGRDKDKKAILDMLLRNDGTDAGVYSVIPIVGMGGIGKTTLAQLVYNDDCIKDRFDLKAWVCVSDKFDTISITKIILRSLSESCEMNDLNLLQVKLKEKLSRKKFLLVLDDVWSHNYNDWSMLRSPFDAGERGSKIILTTRDSKVSSNMTTAAGYSLEYLSEEDSLRMLAHDALEAEDFTRYPYLKEIGLGIVKKCNGLPLATKTLGGLLRTKVNRVAWNVILESDIWNLRQEGDDIIPALWLSYYYLPSQLKQCFAYCSLIPKDYEFKEEEIVLLWMAEGFLSGANTRRKIEDLGSEYFQELVSRSFFQASSNSESLFVMHDLINDLAQFVGGEKYSKMERHEEKKSLSHIRHCSYIMPKYEEIRKFEILFEAKSLRTLMLQAIGFPCVLSGNDLSDLLSRLKCLRVFSLKRYRLTEIPDSIGNLRHLRYLDFSYTLIRCLPDSICTLYNLETLLLRFCIKLEKLPSNIGILENLSHLDILGSESIKEMPSGIGKLTNLQALSKFIVGQGDALNLSEMRNLSNLKGQLSISELQNVNDARYAGDAMLSCKHGLHNLKLEWSMNFDENLRKKEVEKEVLELLRPHEELRALAIYCYAGIAFPGWIEDPSFKNLRSLVFANCGNCPLLPAVGKLPFLKDLCIKGMNSVASIDNEFYGENCPNVFPSLETLRFEDMPEWEEWKICEARKFPSLRDLRIVDCPKLIGHLPEYLLSLEKLEILDCQKLVVSISNLPMLCALDIRGCKKVVVRSFVDLWSVKKIEISNIPNFACVTKEMTKLESIQVEDLKVRGCEELVSSWQTQREWLVALKSPRNLMGINCPQVVSMATKEEDIPCNIEHLEIKYCEGFEKLSEISHNFMRLRKLEIVKCPKLVSLLADSLPSTLKSLVIYKCENLFCLLEDGENIDFSSTSHLEDLEIRECKALKSLSSSSKLPMRLKKLAIENCPELEFVAQEIGDNNCLEYIQILNCENIKYLPQEMDKLEFLYLLGCEKLEALPKLNSLQLQELQIIDCPRVASIPERGLPTNLRKLTIFGSNVVKAVMDWGLDRLTSLTDLQIGDSYCIDVVSFPGRGLPTNLRTLEITGSNVIKAAMDWGLDRLTSLTDLQIGARDWINVVSFPERGLPTNLRNLSIPACIVFKAVMDWGLDRLTSLTYLHIVGKNCIDVSFPPKEIKLPHSLNYISIRDFKNLRKISSKGFQDLSSLRFLKIQFCPKLKSLPKKELLPSLFELRILGCPVLEKRCKRGKGKYWSYVAGIPEVQIS